MLSRSLLLSHFSSVARNSSCTSHGRGLSSTVRRRDCVQHRRQGDEKGANEKSCVAYTRLAQQVATPATRVERDTLHRDSCG